MAGRVYAVDSITNHLPRHSTALTFGEEVIRRPVLTPEIATHSVMDATDYGKGERSTNMRIGRWPKWVGKNTKTLKNAREVTLDSVKLSSKKWLSFLEVMDLKVYRNTLVL